MTKMPQGEPMWHHWLLFGSAFGMSAFFVLSGFVIHYNYAGPLRFMGFAVSLIFFLPALLVCIHYIWFV